MADAVADIVNKYGGVSVDQPEQPAQPAKQNTDPAVQQILDKYNGVAVDGGPNSQQAEAEKPDRPSDLGSAALSGLKQTFAPFLLSKDDLTKEKTGAETAVEVGTNLATDIGLGAAIGSFVGPEGTLVGGAAGGLVHAALAVYRGFGYEYAQAHAGNRDFDPVKGVVNSVAQINPLIGKGGRLAKAGTMAITSYLQNKQYSHDEGSADTAAVVGGLLGGVFHQNTGEWLAVLGQAGFRPTAGTDRVGATVGEMDGLIQIMADKSRARMGDRIEKALAAQRSADPEFFQLGSKLEAYDAASSYRRGLNKINRLAESVNGEQPASPLKVTDGKQALLDDIGDFKRWFLDRPGARVMDGDVQGSFDHYAKTLGEDRINKAYELYKTQQVALQQVDKFNAEVAQDLLYRNKDTGDLVNSKTTDVSDSKTFERVKPVEDPLQNGWVDKLRDIKFVMRKIDNTLGTNLDGTISRFSAAKYQQSVVMATYMERANNLVAQGRKIGLDNETIGKWLAEADLQHLAKYAGKEVPKLNLSEDELKVANGWRQLFEDARTDLNNRGMKVDFLRGLDPDSGRYLPMRAKTGADASTAIRREVERLQDDLNLGNNYLNSPESGELRRAVGRMMDIEPEQVRMSDVDKAQHMSLAPDTSKKMMRGFEAGATFQRAVGLPAPEFIRDFDVGKLFTNYMNNNFKAVFYHEPFMQLSAQLDILKGMGFNRSAAYVQKYIDQIGGHQSNFIGGVQYLINKHKDMFTKIADHAEDSGSMLSGISSRAAKATAMLPDFAGFAISSIYPNYLGWNFRAALRDFTKPWLLTAPELGGVNGYGGKTVAKAVLAAAHDKLFNGVSIRDELQSRGLVPGKFMGEGGNVTEQGLRSISGVGKVVEGVDKVSDWSMRMYQHTDEMNRYVTLKVAQQVVKDMQAGNRRAIDYATRIMSEGDKAAFRQAGVTTLQDMRSADPAKLSDILASQLNSKTQFNYGKEGMNEFGRDMGRMFSMFTKWPAMMMSDAAEQYNKGGGVAMGSLNVARRYLAPMAVMMMAGEYLMDTQKHPWQRFLIGNNLAEWSPAQSWKVGTPPVLQAAQDFGKTFMDMWSADKDHNQKMQEAGKYAQRQALSFLPMMSFMNERERYMKAFHPEEYKQ